MARGQEELLIVIQVRDAATASLKKLQATVAGTTAQVTKMNTALVGTAGATKKAAAGAGVATKAFLGLGAAAKSAAVAFGKLIVVYGAIKAMHGAARAAIQFDRALHDLWTLSEVTWPSLRRTGDELLRLTMVKPIGIIDATEAMYNIHSAVFRGAEATHILERAAIAATAGLSDLNTAAGLLTSIIRAYGLEASDAEHISDVLFTTVKYGVTRFHDLAMQFGRLAGVAAPVGASIEEMAAAIATLTRRGILTDWAVTALRQTLMQILRPSERLREVIEELGHSTGRSLIQTEGFAGALQLLTKVANENNIGMEVLFTNVRAVMAVLPLAGPAAAAFAKDIERMGDVAGASTEAFDKQARAFWVTLRLLGSRLLASGIELTMAVVALIRPFIGGLKILAKWTYWIFKGIRIAVEGFMGILARADAWITPIIIDSIRLWRYLFESVASGIKAAGGAVLIFGITLGDVVGSLRRLAAGILEIFGLIERGLAWLVDAFGRADAWLTRTLVGSVRAWRDLLGGTEEAATGIDKVSTAATSVGMALRLAAGDARDFTQSLTISPQVRMDVMDLAKTISGMGRDLEGANISFAPRIGETPPIVLQFGFAGIDESALAWEELHKTVTATVDGLMRDAERAEAAIIENRYNMELVVEKYDELNTMYAEASAWLEVAINLTNVYSEHQVEIIRNYKNQISAMMGIVEAEETLFTRYQDALDMLKSLEVGTFEYAEALRTLKGIYGEASRAIGLLQLAQLEANPELIQLAENIEGLGITAGETGDSLIDTLAGIESVLAGMGLDGWADMLGAAISLLQGDIFGAIRGGMSGIMTLALAPFERGIKRLNDIVADLNERLTEYRARLEELSHVMDIYSSVVTELTAGLSTMLASVAHDFLGPLGRFVQVFTDTWEALIKMVFLEGMDLLQAGVNMFTSAVLGAVEALLGLVKESAAYQALQEQTKVLWQAVADIFGQFLWPLVALVQALREFLGITQAATETMAAVSANVPAGFRLMRSAWGAATPGQPVVQAPGAETVIPGWATKSVEKLVHMMKSKLEAWGVTSWTDIMQKAQEASVWLWSWIASKVPDFFSRIEQFFVAIIDIFDIEDITLEDVRRWLNGFYDWLAARLEELPGRIKEFVTAFGDFAKWAKKSLPSWDDVSAKLEEWRELLAQLPSFQQTKDEIARITDSIDGVKDEIARAEGAIESLEATMDTVRTGLTYAMAIAAGALIGGIGGALAPITWGLSIAGAAAGAAVGALGGAWLIGHLGSYAKGGVVPGAIGAPQLAVVHGGETITPPGQGHTYNINVALPNVRNAQQFVEELEQITIQRNLRRTGVRQGAFAV